MKNVVFSVSLAAALVSAAFGQSAAESPAEKSAVVANARAYEEAYAKGDSKSLGTFFTDDAEYTAEDGSRLNGRAAIEESIRSALSKNKGGTIAIMVESVRVLSPEVLLERGSTVVTPKTGDSSASTYHAVHVKKDGQWKISELVELPVPPSTPGENLTELAWLIGEWKETDKTTDTEVQSEFKWARGGNFITRNVVVKRTGETALEGWQIIGWDPLAEGIRSWTFDSSGGFSEGTWTREGERWLLREIGVAPDGRRTAADNTFTKLGADRFTWESNNRTLDGVPQPSIGRIEINRTKGN